MTTSTSDHRFSAHGGDTGIGHVLKRTLATIETRDLFCIDIEAKDAKFLSCGSEHQWQPDVSHADDTNERTPVFDPCGQSSMIKFCLHSGFFIGRVRRHLCHHLPTSPVGLYVSDKPRRSSAVTNPLM